QYTIILTSYLLFFFFFYCYLDHLDLHSFPTRRFSDLHIVHFQLSLGGIDLSVTNYVVMLWLASALTFVILAGAARAVSVAGAGRDRKSTRLNSSHVAISYAVFCLKKKRALQRKLNHHI